MTRTMLIFVGGFWALFSVLFSCGAGLESGNQSVGGLKTIAGVDLERYAGIWYEIAKITNRFKKKCFRDTTAEYRRRTDGRLDVANRCVDKNGEEVVARGIAKVVDPVSNSKLKVSFVRALGIQLFWGDYWIIGLEKDYRYAVVGEPKRKYAWILSRSNHLSAEDWRSVKTVLTGQGYDPRRFVKTDHTQKK